MSNQEDIYNNYLNSSNFNPINSDDNNNIYHENLNFNQNETNAKNNSNSVLHNQSQSFQNQISTNQFNQLRNSASYQYPSSGIIRNEQNLAVSPFRQPMSSSYKNQLMNSHNNSLVRDRIINAPLSDKIDFEVEDKIKQAERQRYKEDLDYLVRLKKYQNSGNRENLLNDDFRRYQNLNNDDGKYIKDKKRDLYMQYNSIYDNDVNYHRDNLLKDKLIKQDEKKHLNQEVEYSFAMEKERLANQKQLLKDVQMNDLDNYYRKKSLDQAQRDRDNQENLRNNQYLAQTQQERENQYRRKIDSMNGRIYDNVLNYSDFLKNNQESLPVDSQIFEKKKDFDVNKSLAEFREKNRDKMQYYNSQVEERMKDMERQRELNFKLKQDKIENMQMYKNYLDNQKQINASMKQIPQSQEPNSILPSYNYLSRPYASNKKAMDSIHLVKNNMLINNNEEFYAKNGHIHTIIDQKKDFYLGVSKLNHNPILNPISDLNYNKYLDRSRIPIQNISPKSGENSSNNNLNSLQKNGEKIIS